MKIAPIASVLACALLLSAPLAAQSPEPPALSISGYVIDAELDPAAHHLTAKAVVSFSAPDSAASNTTAPISFGLHPALKVSKISDEAGNPLASERTADGSIRVTPSTLFVRGQTLRWSFEYEGTITGNDDGPIHGQKLAAIEEPITFLLYAARWFPVSGDLSASLTSRFTAEMHIRVPQGMQVFASGSQGVPKPVTLANGKPGEEEHFNWNKPGFPGTVIAGLFMEPFTAGADNVKVYLTESHKQSGNELAQTAASQYGFFTASFGAPESNHLNVVELPDGAPQSAWAPELAAIPGSLADSKSGLRLLASTIARQWWGSQISPRTLNDAWITNGMARYSELMFVENQGGGSALCAAIPDVEAGALAYDSIPLSSAARLNPFSPEFQSMTMEKGAMIFHMLRWEIGDKAFLNTLQGVLSRYANETVRTAELEKAAEAESRKPLTAFFSQWVDGTGAPQYTSKYAIYRLGNRMGFRTTGEIDQSLDLFHMPVELSIETEGKTETQKIEVSGAATQFAVDTFGRPRRIRIDPQGWLLKSTPELRARVSLLRGQQLAAGGDPQGALAEYQKALEINAQSSLINYRIGEALFTLRNYQASVNAYRDALSGDGEPRWTEVWSRIALGKIYDLTGQRDRAMNEYRLAIQTNDNSPGAVNEARLYLQKPFKCRK
jgi:tetratricopeptide (TPR) repeat protein